MNSSANLRGKQTAFIIGILSAGVILMAGCTSSSVTKDIVPATDKVSVVGTSDSRIGGTDYSQLPSNDCLFGPCLGGEIGTSSSTLQRALASGGGGVVPVHGAPGEVGPSPMGEPGYLDEPVDYLLGRDIRYFYFEQDIQALSNLSPGSPYPTDSDFERLVQSFIQSDMACMGFNSASIPIQAAKASVPRCQLKELQSRSAVPADLLVAPSNGSVKKMKIRIRNQTNANFNRSLFISVDKNQMAVNVCFDQDSSGHPRRQEIVQLKKRGGANLSGAEHDLISSSTQLSPDGLQVSEITFARPMKVSAHSVEAVVGAKYRMDSKIYVNPMLETDGSSNPGVLEGAALSWEIDLSRGSQSGSGPMNTITELSGIMGSIPRDSSSTSNLSSLTAVVSRARQNLPGKLSSQNFGSIALAGAVGNRNLADLIAYQDAETLPSSPSMQLFSPDILGAEVSWRDETPVYRSVSSDIPAASEVLESIETTLSRVVSGESWLPKLSDLQSLQAFSCSDTSYLEIATIDVTTSAFQEAREACETESTSEDVESLQNFCFSDSSVNIARRFAQNYFHSPTVPTNPTDRNPDHPEGTEEPSEPRGESPKGSGGFEGGGEVAQQ